MTFLVENRSLYIINLIIWLRIY